MNSRKPLNGRILTWVERKKLSEDQRQSELAAKRKKRLEAKGLTPAQRMMGDKA